MSKRWEHPPHASGHPGRAGSLISATLAEMSCRPAKTPSRVSQTWARHTGPPIAGHCCFNVRVRRDFAIIVNSSVARRYSGDVAGTRTGNSFAIRMAPSISLRLRTTNPHFSPRSRPASRAPFLSPLSAGQRGAVHILGEKCGLSGQWLRSGPDRVACRGDRGGPVAFRAHRRGHAGTGALAAARTRLGGRRGASVTRVSARPPPLALCVFPI